jgi:hypothetical protein
MARDLGHDVRRRAKTIKAESLRISRFAERAVADQSSAEQWRCAHIIVALRNSKTETRIGRDVFGIAAVDRVTGEARAPAEILAAGETEIAFAASPPEPRNTDALTDVKIIDAFTEFFDLSDDFVSRNQRQLWIWQFTIDDVQIGAAHRARRHAHEDFARAWMRNWHFAPRERLPCGPQHHRLHEVRYIQTRSHASKSQKPLVEREKAAILRE